MQYLTAIEASKRIGVSEKTIRLWVQSGKLSAHHPSKNRLAIPESEVEQLARERQQYQAQESRPDMELVEKIAELEQRIAVLEQRVQSGTLEYAPVRPTRSRRAVTAPLVERNLPSGAMLARDFARKYGVNPRTFTDHIIKGYGGDKLPVESRPKPGREHLNETEYYLLPEQQRTALAFWQRHGVAYQIPLDEQEREYQHEQEETDN
jgi:excisionase family DNA binding protein